MSLVPPLLTTASSSSTKTTLFKKSTRALVDTREVLLMASTEGDLLTGYRPVKIEHETSLNFTSPENYLFDTESNKNDRKKTKDGEEDHSCQHVIQPNERASMGTPVLKQKINHSPLTSEQSASNSVALGHVGDCKQVTSSTTGTKEATDTTDCLENSCAERLSPPRTYLDRPSSDEVNNPQCALDLTVKNNDTAEIREIYDKRNQVRCPRCGITAENVAQLHEHFETSYSQYGSYICPCGETADWLPTMLKHQLSCMRNIFPFKQSGEIDTKRVDELLTGFTQSKYCSESWSSLTKMGNNSKSLICTACGKDGFTDNLELFSHFSKCVQLVRHGEPKTGGLYSTNSFALPDFSAHPLPPASSLSMGTRNPTTWKAQNATNETQFANPFDSTSRPSSHYSQGLPPTIGFGPSAYSRGSTPSYAMPNISGPSNSVMTCRTPMKISGRSFMNARMPENELLNTMPNQSADGTFSHPDLSRPFKCCHCIKAFKSKALLDQHMHIHFPPKYTCRYCAKKYRWPPVFYHHQRTCKKRPPSTTASSVDQGLTTNIATSVPGSRSNVPGKRETPPTFGFRNDPCSPLSAMKTFPCIPASDRKPNTPAATIFPPYSSPATFLSDYNKRPEFVNSLASAETMGLAALATAMLIRFPLLPPIPPPLGLVCPYSIPSPFGNTMFSETYKYGNKALAHDATFPLLSDPSQLFSSKSVSENKPSPVSSFSTDGGTQAPGFAISSPRNDPTDQQGGSLERMLCVCGVRFENLSNYLAHLAGCAKLQTLVGCSDLEKKHEHTIAYSLMQPDFLPATSPHLPRTSSHSWMKRENQKISSNNFMHADSVGQTGDIEERVKNAELLTTSIAKHKTYNVDHLTKEIKKPRTEDTSGMFPRDKLKFDPGSSVTSESNPVVTMDTTSKLQSHSNLYINYHSRENEKSRFLGSPELLSKEQRGTSYPEELPCKPNSLPSNASTSLMAAMASVLANAAAAAGFQCHGTNENNSDVEPCTESTNSPLSAMAVPVRSCVQCGKEFSSRLSLKQHVEGKHSIEGKYQCPGCSKRYRWGASYYYHKKSCSAIQEQSAPYDDPSRSSNSDPSPPNYHFQGDYEAIQTFNLPGTVKNTPVLSPDPGRNWTTLMHSGRNTQEEMFCFSPENVQPIRLSSCSDHLPEEKDHELSSAYPNEASSANPKSTESEVE